MDVAARRQALLEAFNAHDMEAVKSFYDPSYVLDVGRGRTVGYDAMMQDLSSLPQRAREYQETLIVKNAQVSGDTAELTVLREQRFTGPLGIKGENRLRRLENWREVDGVWKLVGEHCVSDPSAARAGGTTRGWLVGIAALVLAGLVLEVVWACVHVAKGTAPANWGLAGGVIGAVIGGVFGTYCTIRGARTPQERRFWVGSSVALWAAILLLLLLPQVLAGWLKVIPHWVAWTLWALFFVLLVPSILWANKRAKALREEPGPGEGATGQE